MKILQKPETDDEEENESEPDHRLREASGLTHCRMVKLINSRKYA